jgi:ferredoxin-NADP reductase/MOSC domain-containing protein YiiM
MRLNSVNVGKATAVVINGQSVHTAYLKQPVQGRVRMTRDGPEGNEVAQHTDSVYAFAEENYAWWAAALGTDGSAWTPGHFGENLTIAGLDERALCIGDRLLVGEQVELVVAGPRIPCFKLAWRMRQPESFIQRFATSGRTGVYFSVAREGTVGSGDRVALIERSNSDTVADVAALISGAAETTPEHLQELLSFPRLSQTVALGLRSRLYRILDGQRTLEHRWHGRRTLRVVNVVDECADVRSFHLQPADGGPLPRFRAGQFLTVTCPLPDGEVQRTWSLSDYAAEPSTYRVSVKRESVGRASGWMHDNVYVGTELQVRAPAGRFMLDRGAFKPLILVAGGIGVTPLLAMAKSHLARGPVAPPVHLIHCVRNGDNLAFRTELRELAVLPGVHVDHVFSDPRPGEAQGRDYTVAGRLTLDVLADLVRDTHIIHGGRRINLPWYDCDVYLCGPQSFQDSLLGQMSGQGIDIARIRRESFQRPVTNPSMHAVERAEVVLQRSGRALEWVAGEHASLLELLDRHGIETPSICRMGICHACRCHLVSGKVHHSVAPQGVEAGSALLCCSMPASQRIVLDC